MAQEKYLMHMPEGFLILHQLKVAHEADRRSRKWSDFQFWILKIH